MRIVHIMKDGSRRESIKGLVVPVEPRMMAVYRIIKNYAEKQSESNKEENHGRIKTNSQYGA